MLPFGCTGSPVLYIAGQAIKAIHNIQNLVYCDDHILVGDGRRFETQVSGSDAGVCGVWHSQKKFFAIQWNYHDK
jgi:hypothetical protein